MNRTWGWDTWRDGRAACVRGRGEDQENGLSASRLLNGCAPGKQEYAFLQEMFFVVSAGSWSIPRLPVTCQRLFVGPAGKKRVRER